MRGSRTAWSPRMRLPDPRAGRGCPHGFWWPAAQCGGSVLRVAGQPGFPAEPEYAATRATELTLQGQQAEHWRIQPLLEKFWQNGHECEPGLRQRLSFEPSAGAS